MKTLIKIGPYKLLYILLGVSLLYFLIKGFKYAFIGSYVPIVFIVMWILILSWSYAQGGKGHRRALRFWVFLILVWAVIRLGLYGYLQIDSSLTESHLREQFGIVQNAISIGMVFIGFRILRAVKLLKISDTTNDKKEV